MRITLLKSVVIVVLEKHLTKELISGKPIEAVVNFNFMALEGE